jgi:biopolymer transport protein ExbD
MGFEDGQAGQEQPQSSAQHSRLARKTFLIGFAATMTLSAVYVGWCAYEDHKNATARLGYSSHGDIAEFAYQAFVVDSATFDSIVSGAPRRNGYNPIDPARLKDRSAGVVDSQLAVISTNALAKLLAAVPPKPGLLANGKELVQSFHNGTLKPQATHPTTMMFNKHDSGRNVTDVFNGNAFLGFLKREGSMDVLIDGTVHYQIIPLPGKGAQTDARFYISERLPGDQAMLVFSPFAGLNGASNYLVVAFEATDLLAEFKPSPLEMELVGRVARVGRPARSRDRWWDAAGQPVRVDPASVQMAWYSEFAIVIEQVADYLTVDIQSADGNSAGSGGGVIQTGSRQTLCYLNDSDGRLGQYLDTNGQINIVMKAPAGGWQEIGVLQPGITNVMDGGKFFLKNTTSGDSPFCECKYSYDPDFQIAIVAENKRGQRTKPTHSTGFSWGAANQREHRTEMAHFEFPSEDIARIIALKRPLVRQIIPSIPTRALKVSEMAQSTAGASAFGPVLERTIETCSQPAYKWFDLDKGVAIASSNLMDNINNAEFEAWMRQTGADFTANAGTSPDLLSRDSDFIGQPVKASLWDSASAEKVIQLIANMRSGSKVTVMASGGEFPATFLFKTHEGNMGILQITSSDSSGVIVRYKMIQNAGTALSQTDSASPFREYAVNRTLSELVRAAPETPETTMATTTFEAATSDVATALNKHTLDLPKVTAGSITFTQTPEQRQRTLQTEFLKVVVYSNELAAVFTKIEHDDGKFYSEVKLLGLRNGEWKVLVGGNFVDMPTLEENERLFRERAPELLSYLHNLPNVQGTLSEAAAREQAENVKIQLRATFDAMSATMQALSPNTKLGLPDWYLAEKAQESSNGAVRVELHDPSTVESKVTWIVTVDKQLSVYLNNKEVLLDQLQARLAEGAARNSNLCLAITVHTNAPFEIVDKVVAAANGAKVNIVSNVRENHIDSPGARARRGDLQFRWVAQPDDTNSPADELSAPQGSAEKLRVLREAVLTGRNVQKGGLSHSNGDQREILLVLDEAGRTRFADATERNVKRRLAIVWKGKVISAPTVVSKIAGGAVTITGRFSDAELNEMLDAFGW